MPYRIVQVNYHYIDDAMTLPLASPIADMPGLVWKVWLIGAEYSASAADREAGAICLFSDVGAARRYADQMATMLQGDLPFSNASIKQFDVLEAHTMITRALPAPARTFGDMAAEAMAVVPVLSPLDAYRRLAADANTLVIDVRDAADVAATGTIPGALNISFGALTYQADGQAPETWRSPHLADRDRPIIATCILGPLGAMAARLLHDMGFTNVSILEGGVQAWIASGLPVAGGAGSGGSAAPFEHGFRSTPPVSRPSQHNNLPFHSVAQGEGT